MKIKYCFLLAGFFILNSLGYSQVSADYAVMLTATVSENPPSIQLHWNNYSGATSYTIFRKSKSSISWGAAIANLPGDSLHYTDFDVLADSLYEYRVNRSGNGITARGYLAGGIKLRATDHRGTLLLVVDTMITDSLESSLYRLMKDISDDGWTVRRINISRNDTVPHVKELILDEYQQNNDLTSILLFGHVPVPYSGDLNPDGHPDHLGAWPSDVYYGDADDGDWTDFTVDNTVASRMENWNTPGDGKFDQTYLPSDLEWQVGRVDLFDLPSFSESEELLLKQYLDKDHDYRVGNFSVQHRGIIDDNFGAFSGEAFASCAFRNFSPLFGDNYLEADYFTTLYADAYLWSYGCGGGWYQGASGVGATTDFVTDSVKTVFTMLFGSYFGDWDNTDNFLRAPLASKGYALTNCWAGRPYWFFHYMAMGETVGYCAQLTQNNSSTYPANYAAHWVHVALMGDPTLRMHIIKPPSDLVLLSDAGYPDDVQVYWNDSLDDVLGYYVYRSNSEFGRYERVSDSIITLQPFIDYPDSSGNYWYMVRTVKLQETPSGSYYNLSPGISDSSTIIVTTVEAIEQSNPFRIFPNPASENITLYFEKPIVIYQKKKENIFIRDIAGKAVMKLYFNGGADQKINIGQLLPGMYFVSVGEEVRKLVKN